MIQSWLGLPTHFCFNQIIFFTSNHSFDLEPLNSASPKGAGIYCLLRMI